MFQHWPPARFAPALASPYEFHDRCEMVLANVTTFHSAFRLYPHQIELCFTGRDLLAKSCWNINTGVGCFVSRTGRDFKEEIQQQKTKYTRRTALASLSLHNPYYFDFKAAFAVFASQGKDVQCAMPTEGSCLVESDGQKITSHGVNVSIVPCHCPSARSWFSKRGKNNTTRNGMNGPANPTARQWTNILDL